MRSDLTTLACTCSLSGYTSRVPESLPPPSHDSAAHRRALQFLRSQTAILLFGLGLTSFARMSGMLPAPVSRRNLAASTLVAVLTAVGWSLVRTRRDPRRLVVVLLLVDALIGYTYLWFSGGLASASVALLLIILLMTPLFGGQRYAVPMGGAHWLLYSVLLYTDYEGLLAQVLPHQLVPPPVAADGVARVEAWLVYSVACFATTLLAGQASLDILYSQAQLSSEVTRKTAALQQTSRELASANDELASLNDALGDKNDALESAVSELAVVNDQLGRSNAQLARANVELESMNGLLQRSNSRLDQFNTAVSHDLRAPLQAMMARAELAALAAHRDPGRVARLSDQICESAERMARQLDELHKLSRLDDRLDAAEDVHLGTLFGEIVHDLDPVIRVRRARLEVRHPLPEARGSRALLAEVFQNLLANAVKYGAADGPRVRVSAVESTDAARVAVAVEDDGTGIPEADRERVFKLFSRLDQHQSTEGTGAGLAIVRRIVDVHGGDVRITDGVDLPGARVVVELPAPEESTGRQAELAQALWHYPSDEPAGVPEA